MTRNTSHSNEALFDPGYGDGQSPDIITQSENGPVAVWFRPEDAPKPEEYDFSVPHRTRPGWRVYFLLLGIFLCVLCMALSLTV